MTIANSYNFREITPTLTSSGVVGANRLKGLAEEGYECVINLLPDDSDYAVGNEQATVEAQGLQYIYIPVDWNKPTLENFHSTIAALEENSAIKTHIHCAANWRVSGFYSGYALSKALWTEAQAKAHIQDLWQPTDFPQWQALLSELGLKF
ncbi:MAG: protein tyrosine phosphatase family protein [Gammaproteobacteria bacterium]|nr:protein tyrosine phosphatase family protein [Gammaproteobacteria bacterium]